MNPSDFYFAIDFRDGALTVVITPVVHFDESDSLQHNWTAEQLEVPARLGLQMDNASYFMVNYDDADWDSELLMYRMTEMGFRQSNRFTTVALGV